MANKTIVELTEIDIGDVEATNLTILETGIKTFKFRLSTLLAWIFTNGRKYMEIEIIGSETGEQTIDVTGVIDATQMIWMLRDPEMRQMPATEILTTDVNQIVIDLGEFTLPPGTYTLVGV